jgi:hypothetical protein
LTGEDRAAVTDPDYFPHGFVGVLYDRLAHFDIGPDQTLTRQPAALGRNVADLHTVVVCICTRITSAAYPNSGTPTSSSAAGNGLPCSDRWQRCADFSAGI